MSTTIYGAYLSPFVRKVLICLALKGIEYKMHPVYPSFAKDVPAGGAPEDWAQISPLGKIPAMRDEHVAISDSSVICDYLEGRHTQKPLIPKDPDSRGLCKWYEQYADTIMASGMVFNIFGELVIKQYVSKQPVDHDVVNKALAEDVPQICDYLEKELSGKEYLVEDRLSLADVSVLCPIINMHLSGHSPDSKRWPLLDAYYQRMTQTPPIAKIVTKEHELIKGLQGQAQ
jgi:glutathione S-transferase